MLIFSNRIILFSLIFLIASSSIQAEIDEKEISLKGSKILMVIAPQGFRDEELFVPKEEFEKVLAQVTVASIKKGEAKGMLGKIYDVKTTIDEISYEEYNAIVIVGGIGSPKYLWNNSNLIELVKKFNDKKKVIGAICLSPTVLAQADILKDRNATVYITEESKQEFLNHGVKLINKNVVIDGNIVTANGPESAKEFALNIIKLLGNK